MNGLELRRLRPDDERSFLSALEQWDASAGFMFVQFYDPKMSFREYLQLLADYEAGRNLPDGFVPSTTLCGFVDDDLVGRLSIRHTLNEFLHRIGGHIGYGVLPQFRRQGHAKAMLALSLPIAKDLGINKVLVTCDDDNLGSIKTIESCNGTLENKVDGGPDKPLKRRYWIAL